MGFEVRELKSFPYVKNGINDTTSLLNGEGSIKSGAMNAGSLRIDFDIELDYEYPQNYGYTMQNFTANDWRLGFDVEASELSNLLGVGDPIRAENKAGNFFILGTVLFVDNNTIEIRANSSSGLNPNAAFFGQSAILVRNLKEIKSIDLKYNLSPTSSESFSDGFDGGNMIFSGSTNQLSTNPMNPATGSVRNWLLNEWSPNVFADNFKQDYWFQDGYTRIDAIQPFSIKAIPFVVPYWNEGLEENYDENTSPEITIGDNTLKGLFEIKVWRNEERDHNPVIYTFDMEGDIGWYGESGNGGESVAEITDTEYYNVSKLIPSTSLDIEDINRVTITVNRTTGSFTTADKLSLFVAKKVPFDEYNQSKVDHGLTYLYSGAIVTADGIASTSLEPIGKGEITQLTATISGGGQTITYEAIIIFNQSSKDLLDVGDEYILSVGYYDNAGGSFPQLLADQNTYNKNTDETGLVTLNYARTYDPDADVSKLALGGYTDASYWIQDGINNLFSLIQTAGTEGEILSMRMALLSLKDSADDGVTSYDDSENFITVQSFDVPFSRVANNAQGLGLYQGQQLREFPLKDSDPFKEIKVETIDNGAATEIRVFAPLKINWQHWNKLNGVPDVFFNENDTFNGFNERTSNYSDKPVGDEFNTKLVLFVECQNKNSDGTTTTALELPIIVYNYGEDQYTRQALFPDYIIGVTTQKLTGEDTNGRLSSTEPTKIIFTFDNQGRQGIEEDYYFFTKVEPTLQTGFDIHEISTLQDPQQSNPLEPVDGETRLKVTNDGSDNFTTECIFNPAKLASGNFTLSSRIGRSEDAEPDGSAFSLGFSLGFES